LGQVSAPVASLADTHGLVTRPGTRIWASSEGLGWRSVFATAQREQPFRGHFRAVDDHLIVVHLTGPVRVTRSLCGDEESATILPGGAFIMPGGIEFGVELGAALESVHFYLRRGLVDEIADELSDGGRRIELIPRLGKSDPLLEQIGLAFREQLHDGSVSTALYVDHLARAAAARLVSAHSTASLKRPPGARRAGLSEQQLRRAVDFMEANLDRDSSIAELAAAAGLSPVYFARQFKVATGMAPHQYLLRLRVERAKRLLSTGDLPIAAIALDCGFCHQEHLTRVFHRLCGTTPAAYRLALRS
jgi:AraC family transcriptional regulator